VQDFEASRFSVGPMTDWPGKKINWLWGACAHTDPAHFGAL